jgi:hypothetical protein
LPFNKEEDAKAIILDDEDLDEEVDPDDDLDV